METLSKLHLRPQPLLLLLNNHRRPSFSAPLSSISFRSSKSPSLIRASSSSSTERSLTATLTEAVKPVASSILKSTCVAIAAAALVIARFNHRALPAMAAPVSLMEMEKEYGTGVEDEVKERNLEEHLSSNPDDTQALRLLMELKIKNHKLQEAIDVIDRLIVIEPEEKEWPLLKAHVHSYKGEYQIAREQFEEVLAKDPLRVEAFHGLVTVVSQSGSSVEIKKVFERIEKAMDSCKKEGRKEDLRDFKLLVAQVRVSEGKYSEALQVYQELVKEEPTDFRPYLCMGIIYTLLKKSDEAEKQFEKYKSLVPKEHPYAEYFNNNMFATKVFSQKVARETAASKS